MDITYTILAKGDVDDLVRLLPIIIIAAFVAIGSVVKKWQERVRERERRRETPLTSPKAPARAADQPKPTGAAEAIARAAMRSMGIEVEPPAPPKRRPPQRRPVPPADSDIRCHETIEEHHLEVSELGEDVGTIAAEAKRAPPAAKVVSPAAAAGLSSRERARQAMIYHEIFSAAKALRTGGEMWDRA
ncbi:MAG: hypothetical protein ACYS8X_00290 [Planctomycetota bacterium]|jgi:hypothetical protein